MVYDHRFHSCGCKRLTMHRAPRLLFVLRRSPQMLSEVYRVLWSKGRVLRAQRPQSTPGICGLLPHLAIEGFELLNEALAWAGQSRLSSEASLSDSAPPSFPAFSAGLGPPGLEPGEIVSHLLPGGGRGHVRTPVTSLTAARHTLALPGQSR